MWVRLGLPGATWTGPERIGIAAEARAARGGDLPSGPMPEPVRRVAHAVAVAPADIRRDRVAEFVGDGFTVAHYVELVGIVARVVAIDTFHSVVGVPPPPLPAPETGPPTGAVEPAARTGRAWVPMITGATIVDSLSLVPAENDELVEVNRLMYLDVARIFDVTAVRALTRPQMELIAARTSFVNECFY
jgi:hypothetical protein